MNIALIGATGYVGQAILNELTTRDHHVTAIARNTDKIPAHPNTRPLQADVNDPALAQHLQGFDAVISAFNPGWSNPNIGPDFTRGAAAIVEAARSARVPYLLIIGGAGSLYLPNGQQLIDSPTFPKAIYDGANGARNLLRDLQTRRDLNWAFLSPPARLGGALANYSEERTGRYQLGGNTLLMDGDTPAGISVADLAIAIVDDAERKAHLFQHFTVAAAQ